LLNKCKTYIYQRFESAKKENRCKIAEGDSPKSVHFGLNKSQNLGITDSPNSCLLPALTDNFFSNPYIYFKVRIADDEEFRDLSSA
jgi:hypothetical protein